MSNKLFTKSFDDVYQQSLVMYSSFMIDKATFISFSPHFADPFAANFMTAINTADLIPTDQNDLDYQKVLTQNLEEQMALCRSAFQEFIFNIKLAYNNKKDMIVMFSADEYNVARTVTMKMINMMQNAYAKANTEPYKSELIAVGYSAAKINNLNVLVDELISRNSIQDNYIKGSRNRTTNRINAWNSVWEFMEKISSASKIIWEGNETKVAEYLLYPNSSNNTVPGKITGLKHEIDKFTWKKNKKATSYMFETKPKNGSVWTPIYGGASNYVIMSPLNGENDYRVKGINSLGSGEWSNVLTINIGNIAPVSNLSVNFIGGVPMQEKLHITWSIPSGASSVELWFAEEIGVYNNPMPSNFVKIFEGYASEHNIAQPTSYPNMKYFYAVAKNGNNVSDDSVMAWIDMSNL